MADICITTPSFTAADTLFKALSDRGLDIVQEADQACHTLVQGGPATNQAALVEQARKLGAKRVVVVTTGAASWSVTETLGGRILHVDLPAEAETAALLALADLLAAPFGSMMAADPSTASLVTMARRVARFDVSVFINGPTGSGKEVLSRLVHDASPRSGKPFIAINCAAIPENMLEAILFGYEKGAFTGATAPNKGYIRAACGGTLLLDEISELPLGLQAKLLRVLQEKVVTPLGSQTETPVDIRIIATSNRHMSAEVAKGTFREDLYYRLNVFPLQTLPLAARPLDIPVLARAMLRRHGVGQLVKLLSEAAVAVLMAHDWPGNVRELENVMQRALVLAEGAEIGPEHIMLLTETAYERPAQAA